MNFILILIFIFFIFYILYEKHNNPIIKGEKGEAKVANILKKLNSKKYIIINNLTIKNNFGSTQIDHIIISIYGIFVIETKNYSGWIFGDERNAYWTQVIFNKRNNFRNPIKQNYSHIYTIKNFLKSNFEYNNIPFYSIIVFTGDATLKNIISTTPVIYTHELLRTIIKNKKPYLTIENTKKIASELKLMAKKQNIKQSTHKKNIQKNLNHRNALSQKLICPNCGAKLILRTGKYGKFYGCSNYPKCRYTKNI